jgi:nitrite reductase/ring-hydroxylating ferredoxin subunit
MVNPDSGLVNRRRLLARLVAAILAAVAASLGGVLGIAALSPGHGGGRQRWIDAGRLGAVSRRRPIEFTLGFERADGYRTVRESRVVYLVRDGRQVRAFSAVCTHLGCRVAWSEEAGQFRCPCHGGRFAADGSVVAGPPPRGLDELGTRVENGRVLVELA